MAILHVVVCVRVCVYMNFIHLLDLVHVFVYILVYFFVYILVYVLDIPIRFQYLLTNVFIVYCRLVAAAPCIREQFWSLSKYVLSQLNSILKARGQQQVIFTIASILQI